MGPNHVVGVLLVSGLVVFMVGAARWRLDYEGPLASSLPVIHGDRKRRAWIHTWMIAGVLLTIHMFASYGAFFVVGAAAITRDTLPVWVAYVGLGFGGIGLVGLAFGGRLPDALLPAVLGAHLHRTSRGQC